MNCTRDGCWGECEIHNPKEGGYHYKHISRYTPGGLGTNLTYKALEEAYTDACWGADEPDMIVVHPETYKKIKNIFPPKIIVHDAVPEYGVGMKFNAATIVSDNMMIQDQMSFHYKQPIKLQFKPKLYKVEIVLDKTDLVVKDTK